MKDCAKNIIEISDIISDIKLNSNNILKSECFSDIPNKK
jgi:hypothetical protein